MQEQGWKDWPKDRRPDKEGWAPGEYARKCQRCGIWFVGDKKAVLCADCAYRPKDK